MSVRKRFNEIFGLEDGVDEERKRFVQRVNQFIFHHIDMVHTDTFQYRTLFELVFLNWVSMLTTFHRER